MKGKENFSAYLNNSKTPSRPKIIEKYGDNMKAIFDRIPKEKLREMPVIEKSRNFKRKPYINGINKNKKPDINRIDNELDSKEKKILSDINNFKGIVYDYNKEQEEAMNNFEKIQDENNKFSKIYKKIQKEKGKFNTGTYLDYKPFINIASRYLSRNIQVPNLSNEHSIFSGNPLILGGSELQDYFVYNLGNKKKAMTFLRKVDNIVNRKKTGNEKLSKEEREHLEKIIQQEKPKGYIPPETLIPKLKNDIITSEDTCNNLVDFENFFNSLGTKRKKLDYFSSFKNISRSSDNIFNKINKNNKINLNYTNDYNILHLNKNKLAIYKNILNNSNVTGTTGKFVTGKSTILEPSKEYTNISSILSGRHSTSLKFTPISSPFERQKYNNIQNNEVSKKINNSKIDFKNNFNLFPNTIDISSIPKNIEKIRKKSILKNNLRFNLFNGEKKTIKFKRSKSSSKDGSILRDKKDNLTYGTERGEIVELINNIDTNNVIKQSKEENILNNNIDDKIEDLDITNNESKNLILNANNQEDNTLNNSKINNNNNEESPKKRSLGSHKSRIFKPKTPTQKEMELMKYKKLENLFNQALNLGFNSTKDKSDLEEYVISKGRNINKKINKKDTYFNVYKTKEKAIENNLILEEYMIRNGTNDKKSLTKEQNNILDKNSHFINEMINYEMKFKEMLCEETMDK